MTPRYVLWVRFGGSRSDRNGDQSTFLPGSHGGKETESREEIFYPLGVPKTPCRRRGTSHDTTTILAQGGTQTQEVAQGLPRPGRAAFRERVQTLRRPGTEADRRRGDPGPEEVASRRTAALPFPRPSPVHGSRQSSVGGCGSDQVDLGESERDVYVRTAPRRCGLCRGPGSRSVPAVCV